MANKSLSFFSDNKKVSQFIDNYFFELSFLAVLFIAFIIYVIFLKTANPKQTVYVEANVQYGDPKDSEGIPLFFLEDLKKGDVNDKGNVKILYMRIFQEGRRDWQLSNSLTYIGKIQFEVEATINNDAYMYDEQELKIGNPFLVNINDRHFQLLINKVQIEPFKEPDYVKKTIQVKIYNKRMEFIPNVETGYSFKDNNGYSYAKVIDVKIEPSPFVATNQSGSVFLRKDPINFDATFTIETSALQQQTSLVGYDGRPLTIGERFYFNDPLFINIDGYITNIF